MGANQKSDDLFAGTERFEILRKLGEGGMGTVYAAKDRDNGVHVALKTIQSSSPNALVRFKREFRALHDLQHPNLIRLGELLEQDGDFFFTMELVDGVTLLNFIKETENNSDAVSITPRHFSTPKKIFMDDGEGDTRDSGNSDAKVFATIDATNPDAKLLMEEVREEVAPRGAWTFNERKLRSALGQLARAIDSIHRAGKIHRDLKPSNIMVTKEERLVVLDFGLVKDLTGGQSFTVAQALGTAAYMSPEQAEASKKIGPAADWYSLGVILYHSLTGRLPFHGSDIQVMVAKQQSKPVSPNSLFTNVPEDLSKLCDELLRTAPETRPKAEEILGRLALQGEDKHRVTQQTQSTMNQSISFVGRSEELAFLEMSFDDSRKKEAVTVFLDGPSGMGKSEVTQRFTNTMIEKDPNLVILRGRCYERESVPYKAFDGIADELANFLVKQPEADTALFMPRKANFLARLFPVLDRVKVIKKAPFQEVDHLDPHAVRKWMFECFRSLLQNIADHRPLILCIDDFQWADRDSLVMLEEVLHPPDAPKLLLLATIRTEGIGDVNFETVAGVGANVRNLTIPPLNDRDANELIEIAGPDIGSKEKAAILKEAQGHPLFIQEMVRYVINHQGELEHINLDAALWERIQALPAETQTLVHILAVSGAPLTQKVVRLATEFETNTFYKTVQMARSVYVAKTTGAKEMDTIQCYHDRVRESVLANLSAARRTEMHGRIAAALNASEGDKADSNTMVRHLAASGQHSEAADKALEAGKAAVRASAFDQGCKLFEMALRLGKFSGVKERDIVITLAEAFCSAGRSREAAEAFERVAADDDRAIRLRCQEKAAQQFLYAGHIDKGLENMSIVLREIGATLPKTPMAALFSFLIHRIKLTFRGSRFAAITEGELSEAMRSRMEIFEAVTLSMGLVDTIRGADFQVRTLLLTLKVGEPRRVAQAMAQEAINHASQGARHFKNARKWMQMADDVNKTLEDANVTAFINGARGIMNYLFGNFDEAASLCRDSEMNLQKESNSNFFVISTMRNFLLLALRHSGQLSIFATDCDNYVRDARRRGDLYSEVTMVRLGTRAQLVRDRATFAREELDRIRWPAAPGAFHLQHWFDLEARCELDLYEQAPRKNLKEHEASFKALKRSLLLRITMVRIFSLWARAKLLLAAAKENVEEQIPKATTQKWRKAARKISRTLEKEKGVPVARVHAAVLRAAISMQIGQKEKAIQELRFAINLAEEHKILFHIAGAQYRLAHLLGSDSEEGKKLLEEAHRYGEEHNIKDLARVLETVVPGF